MIAQKHRIFALVAATVIMLACVPSFAPASAPAPTFDPNSLVTAIAQTAGAASTQTALMAPTATLTFTPTSTETPTQTPTETPTVTFVFFVPTLTRTPTIAAPGSSNKDYDCQVISQTPAFDAIIQHGSTFDARWKVTNIGKLYWDANSADYRYVNGEKMHRESPAYDFDQSVIPGAMVEFVVPMQAPNEPGTYRTTWTINIGQERFCSMFLRIVVN